MIMMKINMKKTSNMSQRFNLESLDDLLIEDADPRFSLNSEEVNEYDWDIPPITSSKKILCDKDYSLDSPVIIDDMIYASGDIDRLNPNLKMCNFVKSYNYNMSNFHPKPFIKNGLYPLIWETFFISDDIYQKVIAYESEVIEDLKESFNNIPLVSSVLSAFITYLRTELNRYEDFCSKLKFKLTDKYVRRISVFYQFWKIIVLILNSQSDRKDTVKSLKDRYKYIKCDYKENHVLTYQIMGVNVHIGEDFVYFPDKNLYFNQVLTLMMKDIFLSRRNTLLFSNAIEPENSVNLSDHIKCIYRVGDYLVFKGGSKAYEYLGLLEAFVSNRLATLSEEKRDIPKVTDFGSFLESKVLESSFDNLSVREIYQEIEDINNPYDLGYIYGLFRHWGHPIINWREGLKALKEQVTMKKDFIDKKYVDRLASNLAKKIIRHFFVQHKRWPVDIPEDKNLMKAHIENSTWPSARICRRFGDKWHLLPLQKIYDTPRTIPLEDIFDDKALSLTRSELREALKKNSIGDVSTRRLLNKFLSSSYINPIDLLKEIDSKGLDREWLIIGLREKERELKEKGRFFALMSFLLRIYFVVTELLISEHILPLFPAITMTDNLNQVYKKMMSKIPGHGAGYPELITYAYHIDYQKWNNHQRHESTAPIFQVIDKAFGFKNVISRTHEFFEKSLIYHANSPHLFSINDNLDGVNLTDDEVCWNGQKGGLEGLRQKGWSVVSLLMILDKASEQCNTNVGILAQGDNQLICPTYKIQASRCRESRDEELINIQNNAVNLITAISEGACQIGLLIKAEETWASSNLIIYGKIILYNWKLLPCASKRLSRASCLTNDQLPTLKNTLSTVNTTCLTICQQSDQAILSIYTYVALASEVIRDQFILDPILGRSITDVEMTDNLFAMLLFLDGSIGGLGGNNLLRYTIRQFPDSVTESLTFWRIIYHSTKDRNTRNLCLNAGYIRLMYPSSEALTKLIESPDSLNLRKEPEVSHVIKSMVEKKLKENTSDINNNLIRTSIEVTTYSKPYFLSYLTTIQPLFPRFISEFYSSTFFGFVEGIFNLFKNSRTLKTRFKKHFTETLRSLAERAEINGLVRLSTRGMLGEIWDCSASYSDDLRLKGWGQQVYGSTVPHPAEYIVLADNPIEGEYITIMIDSNSSFKINTPSRCLPYLGSATSSQTSIYKTWEKTSDFYILKRPLNLQCCINWFIEPESNLVKTLRSSIESFTDLDSEKLYLALPKRTGSALHRFHSSRFSNGGFCASSHNIPSCMFITTDTMQNYSKDNQNWDFMFQTTMLYCQFLTCQALLNGSNLTVFKYGWSCPQCLRPIHEINLTSSEVFTDFPVLPNFREIFIYADEIPFKTSLSVQTMKLEDIDLKGKSLSYSIGFLQSILALEELKNIININSIEIFPSVLMKYLSPKYHLKGLKFGVVVHSICDALERDDKNDIYKKSYKTIGMIQLNLNRLCKSSCLKSFLSSERYYKYLMLNSSSVPARYPCTSEEISNIIHEVLFDSLDILNPWNELLKQSQYIYYGFSESLNPKVFSIMIVIDRFLKNIIAKNYSKRGIKELRGILQSGYNQESWDKLPDISTVSLFKNRIFIDSEVRHACKNSKILFPLSRSTLSTDYNEYEGKCRVVSVSFSTERGEMPPRWSNQIINPSMSGLRLIHWKTGSHYKIKSMLSHITTPNRVLVLGDGSGGICSLILRKYKHCKVWFNSLLDFSMLAGGGLKPAPPSAIILLPEDDQKRCINLHTCWESDQDLRNPGTLLSLLEASKPQLVICDAQITTIQDNNLIVENFLNACNHFNIQPQILWKGYFSMFSHKEYTAIDLLANHFSNSFFLVPDFNGSFTSEFYIFGKTWMEEVRITSPVISELCLSYLADVIPSQKTIEFEFQRLIDIELDRMIQGFPDSIIPCPWILLENLLRGISVNIESHSRVLTIYKNHLLKSNDVLAFSIYIIYSICFNDLQIRQDYDGMFSKPSLLKIYNLLSALLGIEFFLGIYTNKVSSFELLHLAVQQKMYFTWNSEGVCPTYQICSKQPLVYTTLNPEISCDKAAIWIRALSLIMCSIEKSNVFFNPRVDSSRMWSHVYRRNDLEFLRSKFILKDFKILQECFSSKVFCYPHKSPSKIRVDEFLVNFDVSDDSE
ncbi:TPA_asm: large structural protein [Triaenorhabdovirus 2]|nr:TPA_asm: large structural protein [Triaenorhabdovirus 2]